MGEITHPTKLKCIKQLTCSMKQNKSLNHQIITDEKKHVKNKEIVSFYFQSSQPTHNRFIFLVTKRGNNKA